MGVLSPVSRDSFAAPCPLVTTASAITWSPARRITRSSATSASGAQVFSCPLRRTCAVGAFSRDNLRMVLRARSSGTVPISVFDTTTPRNSMFRQLPTSARQTASATFSPLKGVKRFSARICAVDLSGRWWEMFGLREAASSSVRPLDAVGVKSAGSSVLTCKISAIICYAPNTSAAARRDGSTSTPGT